MLKFTSIVGYMSCGPTYIENFLTIFGQCINVLNYKIVYPEYAVLTHNCKMTMVNADEVIRAKKPCNLPRNTVAFQVAAPMLCALPPMRATNVHVAESGYQIRI